MAATTWLEVMHEVMHKPRPTLKKILYIPALWKRDKRGRFVRLLRKKHTRTLRNYKILKSGMEQLADNVQANNSLMARLRGKGFIR